MSYSVSDDWDLKPGPLLFVYKESIPTLKSSQFRQPTQEPSQSISTQKDKSISARAQSIATPCTNNQDNFEATTQIMSTRSLL